MKSGKKLVFLSPRESFKVNGGAVADYKNPVSVYFKCTSWVSYDEIDSLSEKKKELRKKLRTFFKDHPLVMEYFNASTIICLNISESRVKLKKPTFFEMDITLFQKNGLPLVSPKNKDIKNLKPILQTIVSDLLNSKFFDNCGFKYHFSIKDAIEEMD